MFTLYKKKNTDAITLTFILISATFVTPEEKNVISILLCIFSKREHLRLWNGEKNWVKGLEKVIKMFRLVDFLKKTETSNLSSITSYHLNLFFLNQFNGEYK